MTTIRRSRRPKLNQSGFTLLELVVALGVGSLILTASVMTLEQLWSNHSRNLAHMRAVKQVENALHILQRDVNMAQTVETTGLGANEVLRLTWMKWDSTRSQVVYRWDPVDLRLTRTLSPDNVTTTVAYPVEPQPVFTTVDRTLVVDVTSRVQNTSETRVVEIVQRAGS